MSLQSVNPADEQVLAEHEATSRDELEIRLKKADIAWRDWRNVSYQDRVSLLRKLGQTLRGRHNELALLATNEMGKPIKQAVAEVDKCAMACDYYAEHGPRFLEPRNEETSARRSYVRHDPLGPLLAIMPWNFPYWQVFRAAIPAALVGNPVLLKHASNVLGVAKEIEQIFHHSGFPEGMFATVILDNERTEELIAHPSIRAVTLTGSERAGRSVGATAGKYIKPSVLELGGSDPFIVLDNADLDKAVETAVTARCQNNGQSCIAAKRFIVVDGIAGQFAEAFTAAMAERKVGDPKDEANDLGPLARVDLRDTLHEQVERSIKQGAKLTTGGKLPDGPGYFYPPTVLTNVEPGMAAFDEETFGPAAAIITASDRHSAIELANQTSFGLGASLWTSDLDLAEQLAGRIQSGAVFINEMVKSDPHLPFGGVKTSGYGRELSREGLLAFANQKTIWVS